MAPLSCVRLISAPVMLVALMAADGGMPLIRLQPETIAGWSVYAAATERRIARELSAPDRFRALDFAPDGSAERRSALASAIVVRPALTRNDRGELLDVPSAMVHHWRGAVWLPAVSLETVLARLQGSAPAAQDDVLDSAVLARGPDWMKLYLKLQRRKIVTVVYSTEHMVTFRRYGRGRASSASTATRIAEVAEAGTPREHELPPGDDRGFLWRLNAYWRYEEVRGGVIAECESISLSRDIPYLFRAMVRPMVESTAEDAMTRALITLRARFAPAVRS